MTEESPVLRWYTRAKNVPILIGKLTGDAALPFGPYTIVQFTGGALVLVIGAFTMGWWGKGNVLVDVPALLLVTVVAVFALRLVKGNGIDPVLTLVDTVGALAHPATGTYAGKRVALEKGGRARGRINVALPATPASTTARGQELDLLAPAPAPQRPAPQPVPAAASPSPQPTTSVGRLLAQAGRNTPRA